MDVNHDIMPIGYLLFFEKRLFRAGIDGMRPDCRGDQIVAHPAGDEGLNLAEYLRPHIEDHAGDERPQAHFFGGKGRYIRVVVHVVVAVVPKRISSRQPSFTPQRISSSVKRASRGQVFSCSQAFSSMSSA